MREIKFRAWDKAEKRWYDYEDSEIFIDLHGQPLIYTAENPYPFANTDIELMQYTGLKDKNGKEIYEGDIIKYKTIYKWDKNPIKLKPVVFENGMFTPQGVIKYLGNNIEVIGNIHDNPELLEDDQ